MNQSLKKQFLSPSEEFTPIPFWFWNDHLTAEEILRQIHDFHEKGVMGFVLHPRIGIPKEIVYLSKEFMDLVYIAVNEANRLGMSVILYDEAMYPSGSAQGMVVKDNPEYATRGLQMQEFPCDGLTEVDINIATTDILVSAQAVEKTSSTTINLENITILHEENGKVSFDPPNDGKWSILLFIETFTKGTIRGIHFGEDDGEENAPASADLLNPDAVKKFIRITHDTYYNKLNEFFGNTVIAMFTDEPDLLGRNAIPGLKPWTTDFLSYYTNDGNQEKDLPVLWFEAGEKTKDIRKNYRKAVNRKLTESYYRPISDWCENHHIALTGHPEDSDDIGLLEYFQIPGQDVVWRWVAPEDNLALEGEHSTAGKCSSDAARHRNRRRNLNEVLGVCTKDSDWDLSPGDMKWYLDWLFVRGVNLISPHAFYYSIDGKRRSHERPPDVGPNNHWWPYYKQFSQYMKRLSWLMTDSINITEIAVLCEEDHLPWKIVKPLFENQIEFNYLEESLFLANSTIENGTLKIAHQEYTVIVIEDTQKLEQSAIQKLEEFIKHGGQVIACETNDTTSVIKGAKIIKQETLIVDALPDHVCQEVVLRPSNQGIRFSKVKKDHAIFYLFVNEGEDNYQGSFQLKEAGKLEKWNPWKGTIEEIPVRESDASLIAPLNLDRRESIIYCVNVHDKPLISEQPLPQVEVETIHINDQWFITNDELSIEKKASLSLWNKWDGMEHFSGTLTYENSFEVDSIEEDVSIFLNLGEVHETAQVFINEQEVGVKMWAPYRLEVDHSIIKKGTNTIKIYVKNSMANQMDQVSFDSGLAGPVKVECIREV